MGQQQQTMLVAAGSALKRMILVLAVAALMAVAMTATAAPAFAMGQSAASDPTLYKGLNFGHYQSHFDFGGGQDTAESNPSYRGGKDKTSSDTQLATKQ